MVFPVYNVQQQGPGPLSFKIWKGACFPFPEGPDEPCTQVICCDSQGCSCQGGPVLLLGAFQSPFTGCIRLCVLHKALLHAIHEAFFGLHWPANQSTGQDSPLKRRKRPTWHMHVRSDDERLFNGEGVRYLLAAWLG